VLAAGPFGSDARFASVSAVLETQDGTVVRCSFRDRHGRVGRKRSSVRRRRILRFSTADEVPIPILVGVATRNENEAKRNRNAIETALLIGRGS
jgi:hypothetical protein